MKTLTLTPLKPGDMIRVIAPSCSLAIVSNELRELADAFLSSLGFRLSFGKHVAECDEFSSSSIESRISDLHEAFTDPEVNGIITVLGGYNCNQLLPYIDYELIRQNPKVFCSYSDITALNNAIFAKTGLITYSGPHYANFAEKYGFEYSLEYFQKAVMQSGGFSVEPSAKWSDDSWYKDQENRHFEVNSGPYTMQPGQAEGRVIGGNLCTFNLLQGTEYMPDLTGSILFIEDDDESSVVTFERNLQSLLHQPGFSGVKGVIFGRFQKKTEMTPDLLQKIVESKREFSGLPIIADADFGHTFPKFTIPIGGVVRMEAGDRIEIWLS